MGLAQHLAREINPLACPVGDYRGAFLGLRACAILTRPVGPASILLVAARAVGASLVEQPLPRILPDSVRPIEADSISLLNFDNSGASPAFNAQYVARNFRKATLLDRQRWSSGGAERIRVHQFRTIECGCRELRACRNQ